MPSDALARFCCQNPDCFQHGQRDAGNLSVCGRFGKAHHRLLSHRLLYCSACKAQCAKFKGTTLFNSKLPHDQVLATLEHRAEGGGVRQPARLVGVNVNKDTATRLALLAGGHAKPTHDDLVAFSPQPPRSPVR